MADKKKTETKSEKKSETKTESGTSTDTKSSDTKAPDSKSKAYARGENQKPVTESYRSNWDQVFGKKKRSAKK